MQEILCRRDRLNYCVPPRLLAGDWSGFNLDNPKNPLQYQLLKLSYYAEQERQAWSAMIAAIGELIETAVEALAPAVVAIKEAIADLFATIAKAFYPRVLYLSKHAKKARTRKKNQRRLYKLLSGPFRPGG